MHVIYTGERVRLRPFRDADEAVRFRREYHRIPNDHWGPGWQPLARARRTFEKEGLVSAGGRSEFAVERLDTGELVGSEMCGAVPHGIEGWFGTFILPEHRRRGFGIEAKLLAFCFLFENFPIRSVMSDTIASHTAARKGMEACGMRLQGCLRAAHQIDGQWYDVPWYRLSREEWEQLPIRGIVRRGQ